MNKKEIGLFITIAVLAIIGAAATSSLVAPAQTTQTPTGSLSFTVRGTSDCLRFLNSSVPTVYVPFTIGANQNSQLQINATKMPGGDNGYTDVYIYNGYWDGGTNHICKAENLYPIISEIRSADFQIRANSPYIETFGKSTQQSYTVFFVIPPSGEATFNVTLKPASTPQSANAEVVQTIVIQPDGSISPPTASIKRNGDIYTFAESTYATIKIQKSNVILDEAGFTLHGPYNGTKSDVWVIGGGPNQQTQGPSEKFTIGIDLAQENIKGVTIKNLNIQNFSIGMYMWTNNNTITKNAISENIVGILLSGSNTTITDNYIANNKQGLFFGFNDPSDIPTDIIISGNSFDHNIQQINGCLCEDYPENEPPHAWDNGQIGNYWSDYNGTDANNDGLGDTPYIVDIQNQDRYPLIANPVNASTPLTRLPLEIMILAVLIPILLAIALLVVRQRRQKTKL
jgi:parallel beta-helix repeat protein